MQAQTTIDKTPPTTKKTRHKSGAIGVNKSLYSWSIDIRKTVNTKALLLELQEIALAHKKKTTIDENGNIVKTKVYDYAVQYRLDAIKILVNKTLPDLKSVEMNVNDGATQLDYAQIAVAVNAIREAGLIDITPASESEALEPLPEPPLPQGDGNFV